MNEIEFRTTFMMWSNVGNTPIEFLLSATKPDGTFSSSETDFEVLKAYIKNRCRGCHAQCSRSDLYTESDNIKIIAGDYPEGERPAVSVCLEADKGKIPTDNEIVAELNLMECINANPESRAVVQRVTNVLRARPYSGVRFH